MTTPEPMDPRPATAGCGCPIAPVQQGRPSRRALVQGAAAVGALAALGTVAVRARPGAAGVRYAFAPPPVAEASRDVLVVLSLRGGFDGLNAVVPIGDPGYRAARPTIGIPERLLIPAGGIFGLHPALAPLKPWWDAGRFGAVHAVGQAWDPLESTCRHASLSIL